MAVINVHNSALEQRENTEAATKHMPASTKALAAIVVLLGVVVLGIVAWRVGKWRRTKTRAASQSLGGYVPKEAIAKESSAPALDTDDKADRELKTYKWQRIALPASAHSLDKTVTKGPTRFFKPFNLRPAPLPLKSTPPTAHTMQTPAPLVTVRFADKDEKEARRMTPHVNVTMQMLKSGDAASPLQSPVRGVSMGPDSPMFKSLASASKLAGAGKKDLPRLMVVVSTYVPSLPDELHIAVGEPLRMHDEYEDEWCLVQRMVGSDEERGVVPRFCLQEVPVAQQPPRTKRNSVLQTAFHR
ncbi:uncharacterized protein PHACADRAFT_183876 [Phanerochaete carnosa HHB-10118-sp]|uniref:SH3 domain-containing protein n=1 Tax=Phanerochaete carnosa (strain HHB-10118-sp) TaxID=650164 RepID=K5VU33_PHACS|nr:uncharacterized protein PHACADRAFT_183876 [Phanerochaete carnosa HHB-10118-sp]EKM55023.1 hypothetical protein PHACADRAFT_183876 [Phanerochaete carnosa HHB-10118-sp]